MVLSALALFWISLELARRNRVHSAALAIALAALIIRAYAGADRALHPWDERYHALVAKNLIAHPLVPTLHEDAALEYDYRNWESNHVWLHKPPLALWIAAASMRIFGVSEWPMRLPSVMLSTGTVLATYAMGRAMVAPSVGLVAAAFHAVHGFSVDLAAGRRASDHVDTLLLFLVETGFCAAIAAVKRWPRLSGIVLGAAVGFAYLTKSLFGLLALPIWAGIRLQYAIVTDVAKEILAAAVVAAAIAASWTIYTARAFPLEAAYERSYALRHITEVMENQGGPAWSYVWEMPRFFGELVWIPLGAAVWLVLTRRATAAHRSLLAWIAIPYLVFSVMATKMPAYVMVAAPAIFILQADFWLRVRERRAGAATKGRRAWLAACLLVLALLPARYLLGPTGPLESRDRNPVWAQQLRALNQHIGAQRAVLFNVPSHIEAMFYTPYAAYDYPPKPGQVELLRRQGYAVYVFDNGTLKPLDAR